jgi:peptide/nickel transport system substrate-binding protein
MLAQVKRNVLLIIGGVFLLLLALTACTPETTEVVVTQVVEVEREVTRIVEGAPVTETITEQVEVTRIVTEEVIVEVTAEAMMAAGDMQPESGGTFVIAVSSDPGHFNPGITTGFNVHSVTGSIFNGLVELDDNANPMPDLAESWEVSNEGRTYTFNLVEGVQWHDGQPFTSADVKFTFEEILFNFHSRTKSGLSGIIESIETPDDNTVIFNFAEPYAPLLQRLNSTEAPILPKHIYENVEDIQAAAENLTPIGTGPFKLDSYDIDNQVTLVRNENYFKPSLPYLDAVIFRVIPDRNTQLLALEEGEVDFIWRVPGPEVARLDEDDNVNLYRVNSGPGGGFCVPTLTFNLDREIFSDIRVRQAIARAINRDQLVEQVIFGQGRAATGPISSEMAFAYTDNVTRYPYDIAAANALLDAAGLTAGDDGTRFTIDLLLFSSFSTYGEVVRANLAEIGINVEVMPLDRSAFLPKVFGDRDFDTNIISYCNNTDPSIGVSRMYISSNIGDIPFSNGAGYVNPQIDAMFQQAAQTADTAERAQIYGDIQRLLVDELPYWWLVETNFVAGAGANVHGLVPSSGHVVEAAWLEGGGN